LNTRTLLSRPFGTRALFLASPALKRRAIVECPSVTPPPALSLAPRKSNIVELVTEDQDFAVLENAGYKPQLITPGEFIPGFIPATPQRAVGS